MKFVALTLLAVIALASSSAPDEDETAILRSPFHQHVADFMSQFKGFMSSRPTGRPRDVFKMVHGKFLESLKALGSQRPTGRPSKARGDHAHATWQLHNSYKFAHGILRNWAMHRAHMARLAAMKKQDADETEVISSSFSDLAKDFRAHFDNFLANRPTGGPDFGDIKSMLKKKYQEAKNKMAAAKNAGAQTDQLLKDFYDAKDQLKQHRKDVKGKIDGWEEKVLLARMASTAFGPLIADFHKFVGSLYDPTQKLADKQAVTDLLNKLDTNYEETKAKLKAMKPAKSASDDDKELFEDSYDLFKDYMDDAEDQLEDWLEELEDAEMKAKVAASPFAVHLDSFRKHIDGIFNGVRPTGQPGLKSLYDRIKAKYQESKANLMAAKPDKTASDDEKDLHDNAYDLLKDHRSDAADKLKAWRKQVLQSLMKQNP